MGWSFPNNITTRKALVADLIKVQRNVSGLWLCKRYCTRGNVLWVVWESHPTGRPMYTFIACYLLQRTTEFGYTSWGYKDMDESMGPCYYTCPIGYLDMSPVLDSEYAVEWRKKVRAYHKENNRIRREKALAKSAQGVY